MYDIAIFLPTAATLLTFVAACLALNFTPGADMMFTIASGVSGGPRAAVAASVGINLGVVVHIILASLGVAALIQAEPLAYDALRYIGAAYLFWLAVQMWCSPAPDEIKSAAAPLGRVAQRGFMTNVLNPKTALFIFAFLPQFTDPARGAVWAQIVVLGMIFICTGFSVNAVVGGLAGAFTTRLRRASRVLNRVSAFVFGGLAARLILD
ncbi:MAG: LysE family translocator [Pikeienuella sp.]